MCESVAVCAASIVVSLLCEKTLDVNPDQSRWLPGQLGPGTMRPGSRLCLPVGVAWLSFVCSFSPVLFWLSRSAAAAMPLAGLLSTRGLRPGIFGWCLQRLPTFSFLLVLLFVGSMLVDKLCRVVVSPIPRVCSATLSFVVLVILASFVHDPHNVHA